MRSKGVGVAIAVCPAGWVGVVAWPADLLWLAPGPARMACYAAFHLAVCLLCAVLQHINPNLSQRCGDCACVVLA